MATQIPIDVVRGLEQRVRDIKADARQCRITERDKRVEAEVLELVAIKLEDLLDKWKVLFPDTEKP